MADHKSPVHPAIKQFLTEAAAISRESGEFLSAFSDAQINWRPNPLVWSIGQCFDHLIVTDSLYMEKLQEVVNKAPRTSAPFTKPLQTSSLGKLLIFFVNPDTKLKTKTFKVFYPEENFVNRDLQKRFKEHQDQLIELMKKADGLNINWLRITSPVSKQFKFRIGECFQFLLLHQRRHFLQAKNLTTLTDFPKS